MIRTVDMHTHFFPREWEDLGKRFGTPDWPSMRHLEPGKAMVMVGEREFRPVYEACWDAGRRLEEMDRDGQCVHEGDFTGEFPDRDAAAAAIKLHLQQFASSGHDETGDFWWGRAANGCETRFFIR